MGLITGRPNNHFRLPADKGVVQGQGNLTTAFQEQTAKADFSNDIAGDKIVAPSHGSRMIHSNNWKTEIHNHQ